jgi:glycosyltransferase involved in cell wall biosynthesis
MKINELDIHNNVSFKGIVAPNEINDLMKNYDFYLQTSAVEGMAMSVVQAMQNGLVCLVTPCGEIANYSQDMISAIHLHQGTENGILDFIAKIKLAIGDPVLYDKLSQSAFQSFSDKLSYQESMRNTIESILNQKK